MGRGVGRGRKGRRARRSEGGDHLLSLPSPLPAAHLPSPGARHSPLLPTATTPLGSATCVTPSPPHPAILWPTVGAPVLPPRSSPCPAPVHGWVKDTWLSHGVSPSLSRLLSGALAPRAGIGWALGGPPRPECALQAATSDQTCRPIEFKHISWGKETNQDSLSNSE